ncbi:uncharacterized protein Z520_06175 [Fonsecaea multimorphosa CBS 102226]|uniref:Uncharacterized protein n=1 Tax=Fonsecaea multimorphosa CBS 102226 TaxID=1442371 RepID=A0A0D2H8B0_9EURO|nr:uncharacterized protein Z520_06175 [Fonsecaea multimorphosa CBS 102226]KIX98095.1 hypothetical protein Z520_06175 [Fonsecaea multimorphosa CBS 102226]
MEIQERAVMFTKKLGLTEPLRSAVFVPGGTQMPETVPDDLDKAKEVARRRVISLMPASSRSSRRVTARQLGTRWQGRPLT